MGKPVFVVLGICHLMLVEAIAMHKASEVAVETFDVAMVHGVGFGSPWHLNDSNFLAFLQVSFGIESVPHHGIVNVNLM